MSDLFLHDTRTGRIVEVSPERPGRYRIYACGPTVYGRVHVGNARPFVVFSLLKRFLVATGNQVNFAMNITDVNDKIYDAARKRGISSHDLAAEMTEWYVRDTNRLELGRPDFEPKASQSIQQIIDLIQDLIDAGHAYPAEGDVYFDISSDQGYGSLSHREPENMSQGEGSDDRGVKRNPNDFALWKASKSGEDAAWDSPWGRGRPGWHIECSAMAETALGNNFEIHGGGSDLLFPHHENEAAQSRCARDHELAQVWMHNGMLLVDSVKMSKSEGNFITLHEMLDRWGRDTLIWFFVSAHYRQPVMLTDTAMRNAQTRLAKIREQAQSLKSGASPEDMRCYVTRFVEALAADFNTPMALAELNGWLREARRRVAEGQDVGDADLRTMLDILALGNLLDDQGAPDTEIQRLFEQREHARAERDFATADQIRNQLAERGWEVRDSPEGGSLARIRSA